MRGLGIVSAILAGLGVLLKIVFMAGGGRILYELGELGMYAQHLPDLAVGAAVVLLSLGAIFAPRTYMSAAAAASYAPQQGAWQAPRNAARVNPISKAGFLCGMIIPVAIWFPIMIVLGVVFAEGRGRDQEAAMLLAIPTSLLLVCTGIFQLVLLYKIWAAIADGKPRATPGQAVGFLFIPFFNFYWIFQAWWGWTQDYNRYIAQRGIRVAPRSGGLAMTTCVFILLGALPIVGLFLSPVVIILLIVLCNHAINGVNALAAATQHGSDRMQPVEAQVLATGS